MAEKLCECGCGQVVTSVYAKSYPENGVIKGKPKRFADGHRRILCKKGHLLSETRDSQGECGVCVRMTHDAWVLAHPERYKECRDKWAEENREQINEKSRRYRKECSDTVQSTRLKQRYGITKEGQAAMIQSQGGKCAICRRVFGVGLKPETDHSHDGTKNVRGILCHGCNAAIGYARESIETLSNAIQYLKETQKCPSI